MKNNVELVDRELDKLLKNASGILKNMSPIMAGVAAELIAQTEDNFDDEGRPKWAELKPSTIAQREKKDQWPGKIMQRTGQLAASYQSESGTHYARIGSNKKYAAIQNLGGKAGRGRKTKIPARPQLPITAKGELQPETQRDISLMVVRQLENHFK